MVQEFKSMDAVMKNLKADVKKRVATDRSNIDLELHRLRVTIEKGCQMVMKENKDRAHWKGDIRTQFQILQPHRRDLHRKARSQLEKELSESSFQKTRVTINYEGHGKTRPIISIILAWSHFGRRPTIVGTEGAADSEKCATGECAICWSDDVRLIAFLPCGHICCGECSIGMLQCPFCRQDVTGLHPLLEPRGLRIRSSDDAASNENEAPDARAADAQE